MALVRAGGKGLCFSLVRVYFPISAISLRLASSMNKIKKNKKKKNGDEDNSKKETKANDRLTTSRLQKIKADNQDCIKLTKNVLSNSRAKHIEIRYHYVRDMWEKDEIDRINEPTVTMMADVLTKAIPKDRHWEHTTNMGVRKITEQVGANKATRR